MEINYVSRRSRHEVFLYTFLNSKNYVGILDISNNLCAERTKVHKYVGDSSSDSDCDAKTSSTCDFYDHPGKYSNHRVEIL